VKHRHLIFEDLETTGKREIVSIGVDGEVLSNTVFNHTAKYKNV